MRGLLREVGRARRAMEEFTAAQERIGIFSVRLEELAVMHAGDAYALLTGSPGVDEAILRQLGQAESAAEVQAVSDPVAPDLRGKTTPPLRRGVHAATASWWNGPGSRKDAASELRSDGQAGGLSHQAGGRIDERAEGSTGQLRHDVDTTRPRFAAPTGTSRETSSWQAEAPAPPSVDQADSTTVLAQRFEQAGLKTAWETVLGTTGVEPTPAVPPAVAHGAAPGITTAVSRQLLRVVERAERAGLASRRVSVTAEGRESVAQRPLTPAEAEKLQTATTTAAARGVQHDREWDAAADDDAARHQRLDVPTGTGLRRLASLAGVLQGDAVREDPGLAPRAAHGMGTGHGEFVTRLAEALRFEAIRGGIDPEELIR